MCRIVGRENTALRINYYLCVADCRTGEECFKDKLLSICRIVGRESTALRINYYLSVGL